MSVEISVTLIALAFTALVVYLILTLKKAMNVLDETNSALSDVRKAVNGITSESKQLIHTANEITIDVKDKIKAVDPLIETAHDVGEALHSVTNTVRQAAEFITPGQPATPQLQSTTTGSKINFKVNR
ncbi:DUF948 domain-containing protein [Paenibacillus swuensis]|uniref:DUF948 domain-containing protein n=1 Tax=Paenibacillus swuensis TaxID=1178515 RepID=UPI0008388E98|nr:DUF948 domain-containing protein [Paenibacillus swuensis]